MWWAVSDLNAGPSGCKQSTQTLIWRDLSGIGGPSRHRCWTLGAPWARLVGLPGLVLIRCCKSLLFSVHEYSSSSGSLGVGFNGVRKPQFETDMRPPTSASRSTKKPRLGAIISSQL